VGLYDPVGGERLTAADREGVPWPDNVVILERIELR
jgi:hypothetical protein